MNLPHIIEYIMSLQQPGGRHLAYEGASGLTIPIFPPNTSLTLSSGPYRGDFANIIFLWALGPMVPNQFYSWAQQYGSRMYDGLVVSCLLENDYGFFAVVTKSEPATIRIDNRSPLCQRWESYLFMLCISTEADLNLISEALGRLGTSTKSEDLAAQTNSLLTAIAKVSGAQVPQPPISGGA